MKQFVAAIAALLFLANPAQARLTPNNDGKFFYGEEIIQVSRHHISTVHRHRKFRQHSASVIDANGNDSSGVVRSHKTGATAHVSSHYASAFQGYIDDLESLGATIRFMGGIRSGRCWSGGMHPCGKALDVCQLSRGRVDSRCHLPGRIQIAAIAERHGLFEGGQWCNSDYGHAQVGVSATACGTYGSARSHHRRHRIAMRL